MKASLALLPVVVTLAVYPPVRHSGLGFDELVHLYNLVNFGPLELLTRAHGGHLLFLSNLSYWVLYDLFGVQAQPYYWLALITHLANVALCYLVIAELTGRSLAAALSATIWGCAAVHIGTVGWFAVYGQVLLTTIVLWMLYDVARLDVAGRAPTRRTYLRWGVLLVAACGTFGYGLAIAALWFAAVSLMLDEPVRVRRVVARVAWSSLAVATLYLAVEQLNAATSSRAASSGVDVLAARLSGLSWNDATFAGQVLAGFTAYGVATLFPGPLLYTTAAGQVGVGPLQGLPAARAALAVAGVASVWLALFVVWLRRRPGRRVKRSDSWCWRSVVTAWRRRGSPDPVGWKSSAARSGRSRRCFRSWRRATTTSRRSC